MLIDRGLNNAKSEITVIYSTNKNAGNPVPLLVYSNGTIVNLKIPQRNAIQPAELC